jgi:hypothetical protein
MVMPQDARGEWLRMEQGSASISMAVSAAWSVLRVCSQRWRGSRSARSRAVGGGAHWEIFSMGEWKRRERGR